MQREPRPRRDLLNVAEISGRLGSYWTDPQPLVIGGVEGEDSWLFDGPGGARIIVSVDPDSEPGTVWIHASTSYRDEFRIPSYGDLKRMHAAVFGDGHAYQCFVPTGEHISIRDNVLHLWGRLDGKPVLPDFGRFRTI